MASPAAEEKPAKRGCCGCGRAKEPDWGMVPTGKRKCRDVLCLLLFGVFWIGMLAIGGVAIKYGKWERLVYGTDYAGDVCGSSPGKEGLVYITYPRTNEDFIANLGKTNPLDYKFYGICVDKCPGALDVVCNYGVATAAVYTMDVKRGCIAIPGYSPPAGAVCSEVRNGCYLTPQETSSIMFRCIPSYNVSGAQKSTCAYPPGITSAYDPACIIVQDDKVGSVQRPAKPNMLFDQLNTARQLWGRWFGDLARSWWVILACAVGVALVMGFVWVTFLKYFTGCMVWTTIFLVVTLLAFLTGFFYYKAGLVQNINVEVPSSINDQLASVQSAAAGAVSRAQSYVPQQWTETADQYKTSYSAVAYVSTAVLVIVLCIIVAVRKSINTAIDVIRIGTDALKALPGLLFFPCTNILCIGLFLVWWLFVAACLQSAGELTAANLGDDFQDGLDALKEQYGAAVNTTALIGLIGNMNTTTLTVVKDMPVMNYLMIYHVFGLLWTAQFIQGIGAMTVAGSVCAWYFSQLPKEAEGNEEYEKLRYAKSRFPICGALYRTVRFYLGSIAFGSLLIAFIQFIRIVFAYVQKKLEPQAKKNASLRFILCCIQCCLKCLQSLVETVTRNAYIFTALKGRSFCASGGMVFKLIVSHGTVFAAVNVLGEIIMFLGKLVISVVSAWIAYILLDRLPQFQPGGTSALSSTWLPILLTLFFSYVTASGFMMIFDLSVDSVLVCYCTDVDENKQRHGGDSAFAVALHMHRDKLMTKGKGGKGKSSKEEEEGGSGEGSPKRNAWGAGSEKSSSAKVAPAAIPSQGAAALV